VSDDSEFAALVTSRSVLQFCRRHGPFLKRFSGHDFSGMKRLLPGVSRALSCFKEASMRRRLLIQVLAVAALPLFAVSAFSAGEGGGGSDQTTTQCKKGMVWDKKLKKCVAPKQGMLDDDNIYEAGHALAMAGRYDEAIAVLSLAANKQDPRILNYLGYSHRHSGRVTVGLGYYEEALRIDPDYTLVREYLGEAHLQIGDLAGAQQQLREIEKRTGKGSREYGMLSEQIDRFMKS
jgi:tetratricopeptide (TPR) repeat protein